ncbi:hypothetical protein ABDK00_014600 [Niabella insulamsoli]|uniref:hypothetical protein n=1 Tax=Niabella insulamsoli TaxID=3144874 RepID=UPI0031FBAA11
MYDALAKYLFEKKQLGLPQIGVFTIKEKKASPDLTEGTITPPGWEVDFAQESEAPDSATENKGLYEWLATHLGITAEAAEERFLNFAATSSGQLEQGGTVVWKSVGSLKKAEGQIQFVPESENLSPFTMVAAKKIIRQDTSHATIVGDRETTTSQMREQLALPPEKGKRNTVMWVLFAVAAIAAIVYFTQNGCNTKNAGNRQKVESQKSGETYKIK